MILESGVALATEQNHEGRRVGGIVAADHLSKWYGQVIGLNDVTLSAQ